MGTFTVIWILWVLHCRIQVYINDFRPKKIAHLRENSNFFRSELKKMGFDVLGDYDSPLETIKEKKPLTTLTCSSRKVQRHHSVSSLLIIQQQQLPVINRVGDLVGIKYLSAEPKK
ncbi:hypothetical protein RND71_030765 [Anisodus tanguticus]|uniref:Uncharacterized protein n=1 Tax=Anisodus tanguticus TaxID=243964 RepID=A0AAE1RIT7_9SOLA|nr:hypothetical protein RND71_030765 [Anisodus tanguticus]